MCIIIIVIISEHLFLSSSYYHPTFYQVRYGFDLARKVQWKSVDESCNGNRRFFIVVTSQQNGATGCMGIDSSQRQLESKEYGAINVLQKSAEFDQSGALFGLVKTLHMEWPHVYCKAIDFQDHEHRLDVKSQKILDEILDYHLDLIEIGYNRNQRFTITTSTNFNDHLLQKGGNLIPALGSEDVLLVPGGARGITPHCLREIAKRIPGITFILMGRSKLGIVPEWAQDTAAKDLQKAATTFLKSEFQAGRGPKPTPMAVRDLVGKISGMVEVADSMKDIEKQGGKVFYESCDVCGGVEKVVTVLKEVCAKYDLKKITGLVHASGVIRDKKIEQKTRTDFDQVYGTKVDGLVNVLKALNQMAISSNSVKIDLQHVLLLSSLAGFCGNLGQSDYAMANDALNKCAQQLHSRIKIPRVQAMCFGPWDSGMVTPALKENFKKNNVEIIPLKEGAELVAELFCEHGGHPQILIGNWMKLSKKNFFPANEEMNMNLQIPISLEDDNSSFLYGHSIDKKKITLPLTTFLSLSKQIADGISDEFGNNNNCCHSVKCFQGIHMDINTSNPKKLLLSVNCMMKKKSTKLSSSGIHPGNSGPIGSLTIDFKHDNRNCFRVVLEHKGDIITKEQKIDYTSINEIEKKKLKFEIVNNKEKIYQYSFHTKDFQVIDSLAHFGDCMILECENNLNKSIFEGVLNCKQIIDLDSTLQSMVLFGKLEYNQSSLPTAFSDIIMYSMNWPQKYKKFRDFNDNYDIRISKFLNKI